MGLLCGPGATLAVFLALYKYRKIWGWIHGIYFITIFIIATIITIPIWLHTGFISYDTTIQTKRSILGLRIHYVIGVIILIEMIITILGGLAIKT